MNKNVIEVSKLHKKFWYFKKDFKAIHWLFNKSKYDKEFYVLKGLDFSIKQGEKVGILGKNGAGKSTLLKIIAEVYYPTYGEVKVEGNISSLLELGSGFNGQLTGRENIYLKGTLLGMNKSDIDKIIDDVIDFADIGDYIEMPFNSYSSGMRARLGFAMAINTNPDILIIDEVFAVGDKDFQMKSRAKTEEFFEQNKTILFVSHSEGLIRQFCDRVLYLKDGHIVFDGDVEKGLEVYNADVLVDSYVPRVFVDFFDVIQDTIKIVCNYGVGVQYDIHDKLNCEDIEVLAEGFTSQLTNYFPPKKIDIQVEKINNQIVIMLDKNSIVDKINLRIKFHDTKWSNYNYVHYVNGELKSQEYAIIDGVKFTGNNRDIFTIEPN